VPVPPFRVNVAGLRRRPGARRQERRSGPIVGLAITSSRVPERAPVVVDVVLEVSDGGIVASGTVRAHSVGECRRCLREIGSELVVDVRELYEPRPAGGRQLGDMEVAEMEEETYPLTAESLDLLPLARDAILLNLPQAPLCRADCAGLCPMCGADLNEGPCSCRPTINEGRWAALDALRGTETQ
jgi:uncharacterized protein